MYLSFNEIKQRSIDFSNKWADACSEISDAKSFWDDFFTVFGISRKRIASFEYPIRNNNKLGYIDLFWKGTLVVEHKSKGKSLDKAYSQALSYFSGLNDEDLPKYVIVSDFTTFRVYNLERDSTYFQFALTDLYKNIHIFSFITGYKKIEFKEEEDININAGKLLGKLYRYLKEYNSDTSSLSILLIRILFCLFADHTGIWQKNHFQYYILQNTKIDGSDLGAHLFIIFDILNIDFEFRPNNLSEDLSYFPYINGGLFKDKFNIIFFDKNARDILIECCKFNWSEISPVIFGTIFQNAMDSETRDKLGIHYTSEKDILKLLDPLFLTDLRIKYNSYKYNKQKLEILLKEIQNIKILDPACGCGNFLILSYRQLRLLQTDILKSIALINGKYCNEPYLQLNLKVISYILDVDSMFGFEIDGLASRIAQVALWLVDHQLNTTMSLEFNENCVRLPLKKSPNIYNINALRINWSDYVDINYITYIVGNPPYIPANNRSNEQKKDMDIVFKGTSFRNYGKLDYVCSWFCKTAELIKYTSIKAAFISTNSITQGEQVEYLWKPLINDGLIINFAHRTFAWKNGLSNDASVFVVIIGFSFMNNNNKVIYEYDTPNASPHIFFTKNINPYLLDKPNIIVNSRRTPLSSLTPKAIKGSMPNDKGHLLLSNDEKISLCNKFPGIEEFIKPYLGAYDILNNTQRWCLWLKDYSIEEFIKYRFIKERISLVIDYRRDLYRKSEKANIKRALEVPYLFETTKQPTSNYIIIPRVSSEKRKYIPMKICSKEEIVSDSCIAVYTDDKYILGVLMSSMHMAWVRNYCGRLKNDYRYSITLCYNTFPFIFPSENEKVKIITLVDEMLKIRSNYPKLSLAELYNPLYSPKDLIEIHKKIDIAIEKLYFNKRFNSDEKRVDILLEHYFTLYN
ncbi:DNA methyltransferase [Clostridium sp. AL.422]|uniref:class I SAM-dependent DNA methyltransferase n=1 Tax=Clostridium TaxID=1485 RepID=UPI00293DA9FF|nr:MULTISPECIES: DNA methyltransferase [unclassified Clostridium]MDV4151760.1 DNA methyltransferase [Clostridium sp. AL.422]